MGGILADSELTCQYPPLIQNGSIWRVYILFCSDEFEFLRVSSIYVIGVSSARKKHTLTYQHYFLELRYESHLRSQLHREAATLLHRR